MAKRKEKEPRAQIQRDFTKEANEQKAKLMAMSKAQQGSTEPGGVGEGVRASGHETGGHHRIDMKAEEFEARFEPAFDWCLIKMTPREETVPDVYKNSGLVEVPSIAQQHRNKDGIVVKIGPHAFDADYKKAGKPCFKVGDRVWYGAWAGQETPCPPNYILVRSVSCKLEVDKDLRLEWH
tara:strand:+ start:299 stop:838 length:540 start_codon:yes stop_codon:yes gene_type:complete